MTGKTTISSNKALLVLLDNTVLSNFAQVGRSDLILNLWESVYTTVPVMQEYQEGVRLKKVPVDVWNDLGLLKLTPEEMTFATEQLSSLGIGESSCLAVAHYRRGVVLTDDMPARKIALKLGVQVSGTLGVLVFCIVENKLTLEQANAILKTMILSGYRSPTTHLETLLPK